MNEVYLLTGSNIGNAHQHLQQALQAIHTIAGNVVTQSSVYRTAPWGNKAQDDFLNQVLKVNTALQPDELMEVLLSIEQQMGRVRTVPNAPRIIDVDILFYNQLVYQSTLVEVPHPRLHLRRFVLQPLCELVTDLMHPVWHKTIRQLLAECTDTGLVEKM